MKKILVFALFQFAAFGQRVAVTDGLGGGYLAQVTSANALKIDGSASTQPITSPDSVTTGTITAADAVVAAPAGAGATVTGASTAGSLVALAAPGGDSSWIMQISGTLGGSTFYFEGSLDSTNGTTGTWININGRQTGIVNTVLAGSTTTASIFRGNTSGWTWIRMRAVGGSGISAAVRIEISSGTGAIFLNASVPAGANIIGKVGIDQTTPGTTNLVALAANQSVNIAQVGGATPDPCFGLVKSFFSISQTGNTQIITGTSAKKIYFCAFNVGPNADAENISVVEGTGSVCGTATVAVPGFPAATAANGWQMAANGGLTYGSGIGSIAATSVNADNVCLFMSGSGRIAGGGSYVVQ